MNYFDKEEAIKRLPVISNKALYDAVDLALWLYLEKGWTLVRAVAKASEKRHYKPKSHIEKLFRVAVPQEIINSRQCIPNYKKDNGLRCRLRMLRFMEKEAAHHIKDIIQRD